MDKYSVIIPTLWRSDRTQKLINDLQSCELVDEIIVIDNSADKINTQFNGKVKIISFAKNIYVNPAWNVGVKLAKNECIALCNDDINFNTNIFSTITKDVLTNNGIIGMGAGNYTDSIDQNATPYVDVWKPGINDLGWGCLIFLKKSNWVDIPDEIKIWYGDNFIKDANPTPKGCLRNFSIETEMSTTSKSDEWAETIRKDREYFKLYMDQKNLVDVKVSSILQYSTIDITFLKLNLTQLSKFSDEIIIPICDNLFDGSPEDPVLMEQSLEIIKQFPKAQVIKFPWPGVQENISYYHTMSRQIGTIFARNNWLFFVDTDEIVTDEFGEWFNSIKHQDLAWWLTCYWYFREPIYQSKKLESAGLLIQKQHCQWRINDPLERQQLFQAVWDQGKLMHGDLTKITSNAGNILMHHFSWVRTKEQMLKKVETWGHAHDKNWAHLVHDEFSRPFNGTDFVHNYEYNIVDNIFNIVIEP